MPQIVKTRTAAATALGMKERSLKEHEVAGMFAREPDGSYDIDKIRSALSANVTPTRGQSGGQQGGEKLSYAAARALNENLKSQKLTLDLAEQEGRLIDRADALVTVRTLAQQERDAILAWPARAAPLIAAELGVDEHRVHTLLDDSLRAHLLARAEAPPEL